MNSLCGLRSPRPAHHRIWPEPHVNAQLTGHGIFALSPASERQDLNLHPYWISFYCALPLSYVPMCPRPLSWPASFQGALDTRPSKARFTVNFLRVDYLPLLSVTAFFTFIPVNCSRARYYFISSAFFTQARLPLLQLIKHMVVRDTPYRPFLSLPRTMICTLQNSLSTIAVATAI